MPQLHPLRSPASTSLARVVPGFWLHGMITHSAHLAAMWCRSPISAFLLAQPLRIGQENSDFVLLTDLCIVGKPSSTSELDDVLVVDSVKEFDTAEPVMLTPPAGPSNSPALLDATLATPVLHPSSIESLLVGLSTQLASLTATLHREKKGGVGQTPLHLRYRTRRPRLLTSTSLRLMMRIYLCSQAVSPTVGTGAAPHWGPALDLGTFIRHRVTAPALVAVPRHRRPKCHSHTIHGTAPAFTCFLAF